MDKIKGLGILFIITGLGMILLFSGQILFSSLLFTQNNDFALVNPETNEAESLYFENVDDYSFPNNLFHGNKYILQGRIITKLKINFTTQIVNLSIQRTEHFNSDFKLGNNIEINNLITDYSIDQTGLIIISLIYDQNEWPFYGYGWFELRLNQYPNSRTSSDVIKFNKLNSNISRATNQTNGVTLLENLEFRKLINEVSKFNNSDNEFVKLESLEQIEFLDNTTINYYKDRVKKDANRYLISFSYKAQIIGFTNFQQNFSTDLLRRTIKNYSFSTDDLLEDSWTVTGHLTNITNSEGWIIYQLLDYDQIIGSLNADFIKIEQIIIIDSLNSIQFFGYHKTHIVS